MLNDLSLPFLMGLSDTFQLIMNSDFATHTAVYKGTCACKTFDVNNEHQRF